MYFDHWLGARWKTTKLLLLHPYAHTHCDLHLQISWPYFIVYCIRVPRCNHVTIHLLPFFLQSVSCLGCLPQRWLAGPKEYYQENSFAYITGLSANQSALSKHSNPNRVLRLRDWWVTHSTGAPATPRAPPPPFFHLPITHWANTDWLWLVV